MVARATILFVINSLAGGGAERVLATILGASAPWRDRYDMHLALLDDEPRAYALPDWIAVTQLDSRHRLGASILQLRRLVGRLNPDTALSFLTRANVATAVAMAGRGRPWLLSERVNTSAHLGSGAGAMAARAMVRLAYPRASHVIAVSDGVADDLVENFGVARARVSAFANPVDHDAIAAQAAARPLLAIDGDYIVAAGRLVPNKNFALLIDAFAASGLTHDLVIMGEGLERAALEARVAARRLVGRVHLPGFVENPFAVLARARLFAMSSNAEGFPNGLVEAMACELPVVATNCASGPSEILADLPRGVVSEARPVAAGALVPPNDVTAFAAALREVASEPRRTQAADAARRRSLDYGVAQATERYWRRIDAALAPSRAGGATPSSLSLSSGIVR
ncbi:N-acetylgalactosamine-N, N'-diacetylbacillosaminyl-diphospho-undecaprenol 4-alpha-N-acetylgalactosaminyltransferase [Sphingomonas sp. EC-HK361]|uniref:glycosyltransferase n=1 Tax=Sphingomonas sp. EC-HK361 TaxID=2038397 RepID=UPI001256E4BD|nr:glycosyltransferase [Sphingomonas sp. EC-HK361]VVT00079.1 N-acetylgalactosamine-N, N'-diacetylbacillosaminyl-diphospho-undecaprenol 4-alpha-N-acetylgalactosaminyltransferase [Sphingomonas sp. EC-HK361]